MDNQLNAPLYEALERHRRSGPASYHVPGHKSGKAMEDLPDVYRSILNIDLTELAGLDDLHHPEGAIRDAQQLAAEAWGSQQTFFLVGGSTAGNLASIMAVCDRGDVILVQRDAHKSVLHAIMLAGAKAVFIQPELDAQHGLSYGLLLEDIERAIRVHPRARALVITRPSYYGACADITELVTIVHRAGMPLIVDEAHGAHLRFHDQLPTDAIAAGADAVVQSTHKMLSAMTMGAMLHLQGERIDEQRVATLLTMLQSSSPSYPILASLDLARRDAVLHGRQRIDQALSGLAQLRECLPHYGLAEPKLASVQRDPFKLVLYDPWERISGHELMHQLASHGCWAELADPTHVLLSFSPYTSQEDMLRLASTFEQFRPNTGFPTKKEELCKKRANIYTSDALDRLSDPVALQPGLSPTAELRQLSWRESIGHRSASMITPYPPGIPILYPGECITLSVIAELERWAAQGARIHGLAHPEQRVIDVLPPERSS